MYPVIKRIGDIVTSFIGILVMSPVFIILMIAIKIESKGPVFFTQKRVGRHKTHFKILKFRTMKVDTPKVGRLTKRWIRHNANRVFTDPQL